MQPGSGSGPPRPPYSAFGAAGGGGASQSPQGGSQPRPPPAFGNRPQPFPIESSAGAGRGGGSPIRGGRGGARPMSSLPLKPTVPLATVSQPGSTSTLLTSSAGSHRPRPFTNRSTVFNKPEGSNNVPSQTPGAAAPAFAARPTSSAFGSSAFGSSSVPAFGSQARPASAFGSQSNQGTTFGSQPTQSPAFGSQTSQAHAFGSQQPTQAPTFGSQAAQAPPPGTKEKPIEIGSSPPAPPPREIAGPRPPVHSTQVQPAGSPFATQSSAFGNPAQPASSAAPASTFSNFLRKDRSSAATSGTSTPTNAGLPTFSNRNAHDSENLDEDGERRKRFEDAPKVGNRWLEMKSGREALRASYIQSGVLPDPDKPTDLAFAVKLHGTCHDMCPEYEREEREFQKELDPLEMNPATGRVDPGLAVKIYRRPAAGRELPLPDDVRPPPVLKQTLDYLFHDLLPSNPQDPRFTAVQGFIWNRTRAVRQDFIVQSEGGAIAIECHERIARYHILCLHWRGGPGSEGWSEQQELEQLRKTLRSLIEFYDDRRRSGQSSPNEAEFRSYNLLLHLRDPETLREAELLPGPIFRSSAVQSALNLRHLAQRSNNLEKRGQPLNTESTLNFFSKFFAELKKPNVNYLMACLAENSFSSIRIGALKSMSKAYMPQHRGLPVEVVQRSLGLDDTQQVTDLAQHLGIELEWEDLGGHRRPIAVKIHKSVTLNEAKPLVTPFSSTIVEAKRGSHTNSDIVDGRASGAAPSLPVTTPSRPSAPQPRVSAYGSSSTPVARLASALQPPSQIAPAPQPKTSKLSPAAPTFTPSTPIEQAQPASKPSSAFSFAPPATASSSASSTKAFSFAPAAKIEPSAPSQGATSFPQFTNKSAFGLSANAPTFTPPTKTVPTFGTSTPAPSNAEPFSRSKAPASPAAPSAPAPSFLAATQSPVTHSKTADTVSTASISEAAAPASVNVPPPESKAVERTVSASELAKSKEDERRAGQKKEAARKYAVQKACDKVVAEICSSAASKAASVAMEAEVARRRTDAREKVLADVASRLLDTLLEERCRASAKVAARNAEASAFAFRRLAACMLDKWKAAMAERRDREEQSRRLEKIRLELRRRDVLAPLLAGNGSSSSIRRSLLTGERDPSSPSKRKLDEANVSTCSDDELRSVFVKTRQRRAELWEQGSMLSRLADHVDELFLHFKPADLVQWTALYSSAGDHVASRWLRVKFGLADDQDPTKKAVELDLADGSRFQLLDASSKQLTLEQTGEEVGLLLFELNPALAHSSSDVEHAKLVHADRMRLEKLAASASVSHSLLSCRLLIISWDTSVSVMDRLGLSDKSGWRQAFDRVNVLELTDAATSPEIALCARLEEVMPDLQPNPSRQHRWTLQDVMESLYDQWVQTASLAAGLLVDLPASEVDAVACKTVQILTALANHLLRTAISLSDTLLDLDEENQVLIPVPMPSPHKSVLAMALDQIDTLPEEQALLLRSKLVSTLSGSSIAVDQHVNALLMFSLDKLSAVWIQVHDEAQAALAVAEEGITMEKICRAAIDELSATTRSIWIKHRTIDSHASEEDVEMEPIEAREASVEVQNSKFPQHIVDSPMTILRTKTSLASLRALVARTTAFLNA